jgi:glycosyltransferase involved in cell wall biosynthesis
MGARARADRVLGLSDGRRLRVLRIIGRLNMGGPAHQAALLSGRRFDPERYETLLVHGSIAAGESSLADLAEAEGARMTFVPSLQQPVNPIRDLRALLSLIRVARSFRPDIVHTHTAKAGFVGRIAALFVRPRPRLVHTFHGHVLEGYFGATKSKAYLLLERLLARVTDCLIGVSQATVDDLLRLGVAPESKFTVIRLGLDLDPLARRDAEARARVRVQLGLDPGHTLLVFVGRLVPIKRLDLMIDAVADARESAHHLRLAVVGDGEIRPALEQRAAELGLSDAVHFLGYRRDLGPIFAAADIAVLSSDNEGTPVSLIEASAAGLPSVATDVGGVRDVVSSGTGILVPRGDVPALAKALVGMYGDRPRWGEMGRIAQEHSLSGFGIDRLLGDVDALYRGLVTGTARH